MELMNVKGSYDYLPKEQKVRNYVINTLKEVFEEYGFQPLETPILCYYDLLASKYGGGAEILKEVYKLTDQGNRKLGLRYDLTVPFAKVVSMNKGLKLPFKRYEIGRVFRDGPIKVGRNREFIQCDVDVIGIKDIAIDAEFIALYVTGYNRLGIDVIIEYNNRKLLSGLIMEVGINDNINAVITIVDKFKKLTREELEKEFALLSIDANQYNKLIDYLSFDIDTMKEKFKNANETLIEGIRELTELQEYIKVMGLEKYTIFNPSLARGHDIYTGTVYEAFTKDGKLTSSIGGGGRYDKIITNFINDGNEYPAIGISFGLDIICELIKDRKEFTDKSNIEVYIIPIETKKESLLIADKLRNLGIKVDIELNNSKVKKALTFANKEKIPYVVIIGSTEIENQKFELKDMNNNRQFEISIDNLAEVKDIIKSNL